MPRRGSAVESSTLKDYKRAVLIGDDHTFGKGTVQSVQTLPPGLDANDFASAEEEARNGDRLLEQAATVAREVENQAVYLGFVGLDEKVCDVLCGLPFVGGGAVAVDLATKRSGVGLILEATFTSAKDMAKSSFGFLPVHYIMKKVSISMRKLLMII